ncbi:methionine aminopeptidase [Umbelopsis sp. PMI_123]|nr:methionine aminopeptidase [Umbelopsis sp. PMI_123]
MPTAVCQGPNCENIAKLECPTCVKQSISGSTFCSQDCFKKSWGAHKALHKRPDGAAIYDPFPNFKYTGPLRPVYPLSPKRHVPENIRRPDYAKDGTPISELAARRQSNIKVLSAEEIVVMRKACQVTKEVLEIGAAAIRPGVTTDEIDAIVHQATIERNAYPSPLNYWNYPKSCCTSVNEVICHGIPDKRPLQEGDIVNLDVSCYFEGFHGDTNATYCVGKVDEAGQNLIKAARECLEVAIAQAKPGVPYRRFGRLIEDHATKLGFSTVRAFCGHGISDLFHPPPDVPHYSNNKAIGVLKPGHCFTIEPMICEGTHKEVLWPDQWTATTTDGKRSAQFEHTLLVTETGIEILT